MGHRKNYVRCSFFYIGRRKNYIRHNFRPLQNTEKTKPQQQDKFVRDARHQRLSHTDIVPLMIQSRCVSPDFIIPKQSIQRQTACSV